MTVPRQAPDKHDKGSVVRREGKDLGVFNTSFPLPTLAAFDSAFLRLTSKAE
jgi:hypothetical protein